MGEFLWRPVSGSPVYTLSSVCLWAYYINFLLALALLPVHDHMIITVIIKPIPTDPIGKVIWPKQHNIKLVQVASLASLTQLLPPRSPSDSTWEIRRRTALCACSCCSPIASASAAARAPGPGLHQSASWLLFAVSVRFSYCSPLACVRFGCSSPISTAPRLRALQLLFPVFVRFCCYSPIASASTAAPQLHPLNACSLLTCSGRFQRMPHSQTFSVEFEVQ